MTIVPYDRLDPDVLDALIEEFVTRDGAVQGHTDTPITQKRASVLRQLKTGVAVIVFDEASESCTIMAKENLPAHPSELSSDPSGFEAVMRVDPCDPKGAFVAARLCSQTLSAATSQRLR